MGDFRGYYHDGAYTAAPDPEDEYYDDDYEDEDPAAAAAEAYLATIRERFLALRARLHATPPPHLVSTLPPTNTPYVGAFGPRSHAFSQWTKRLDTTDPLPVQVAAMDRDAALRVLRVVMGGRFLRVGREVTERTSRWVWALLARLPPAGELGHTEVGWIRDLGRRAVLLGRSLAEMAALREEIAGGGGDLGVNDGVDESEEDEDLAQEYEGADIYSEGERNRTADEAAEGNPGLDGDADADGAPRSEENAEDAAGGEAEEQDLEEGEELEQDDIPMEIEVEDDAQEEDLEAAKTRLLAQLGQAGTASSQGSVAGDEGEQATLRARMNMRATINVILTVAGEFYGQRDLLEFRDPFTGM